MQTVATLDREARGTDHGERVSGAHTANEFYIYNVYTYKLSNEQPRLWKNDLLWFGLVLFLYQGHSLGFGPWASPHLLASLSSLLVALQTLLGPAHRDGCWLSSLSLGRHSKIK
jgi:hypothetical protein